MQLCLTLDHRFLQTPDKRIWTVTQCPYNFYSEYLQVFDGVRVVARTFPVAAARPDFLPVVGPGVEFFPVTSYRGPIEYLARSRAIRRSIQDAVSDQSAVIFRVPSQVANSVEGSIRRRRHPFAIDVVADPFDVLSPGANPHPAAPIARIYFAQKLKEQVKRAIAVRYVTQSYLQQRYPARSDVLQVAMGGSTLESGRSLDLEKQYVVAVSDINLSDECFNSEPRRAPHSSAALRALFIGSLGSLYKGPDTLIRAVALAKSAGHRIKVRFAGSGKQMKMLEALGLELGVNDCLHFLGDVQAGQAIRAEIDRADVFVLPSRAEGVPRAMLEAMARSLPCIGSRVGGIPELLDQEDLVPSNDPMALAIKFKRIIEDQAHFQRMSRRNFQTARMYAAEGLRHRQRSFLEAVRQRTQDYFRAQGSRVSAPRQNV